MSAPLRAFFLTSLVALATPATDLRSEPTEDPEVQSQRTVAELSTRMQIQGWIHQLEAERDHHRLTIEKSLRQSGLGVSVSGLDGFQREIDWLNVVLALRKEIDRGNKDYVDQLLNGKNKPRSDLLPGTAPSQRLVENAISQLVEAYSRALAELRTPADDIEQRTNAFRAYLRGESLRVDSLRTAVQRDSNGLTMDWGSRSSPVDADDGPLKRAPVGYTLEVAQDRMAQLAKRYVDTMALLPEASSSSERQERETELYRLYLEMKLVAASTSGAWDRQIFSGIIETFVAALAVTAVSPLVLEHIPGLESSGPHHLLAVTTVAALSLVPAVVNRVHLWRFPWRGAISSPWSKRRDQKRAQSDLERYFWLEVESGLDQRPKPNRREIWRAFAGHRVFFDTTLRRGLANPEQVSRAIDKMLDCRAALSAAHHP